MFVAGSEDWFVRSLADYGYPIFVVRQGDVVVGVAGGNDGFESLLRDFLTDFEKKPRRKLPVLSVTVVQTTRSSRFRARVVKLKKPLPDENDVPHKYAFERE